MTVDENQLGLVLGVVVHLQDHPLNSTNQMSFLAARKPVPKQLAPLQMTVEMKLVVKDRQDSLKDSVETKAEKGAHHPD